VAARASFSVVTPNLNMGHYLAETIESVLRNLEEGDQYIIVDGGSTDNSVDVIRSYAGRLSGWVSEPDAGYADALAKGFARSEGEFECWVNSGDLLLDGALKRARGSFEETGADCIFGDDFYIDHDGGVISFSRGYVPSLREFMLFGGWTPLQDACFWRRRLYEGVGGVDSGLTFAADYDLFLKFSLDGTCAYVPVAFSAHRKHAGQQSIAAAAEYRREREKCRMRALRETGLSRRRRVIAEAVYWVAVRYRARVLHPRWNIPHLVGRPIRSLDARPYGGHPVPVRRPHGG